MTPLAPAAVVADLAPAGRLRAALNYGNPVLAAWNPSTNEASGISADLARELARCLGVPIDFVPYDAAGKVVAALAAREWDLCFLAVDPQRAAEISFTAPYVVIEGVYLVAAASMVADNDEVDQPGTRIGVIVGSAYDLFLSRTLKQATIVRASSFDAVLDLWTASRLDCIAGVKPQLEAAARRMTGVRLLARRFMAINQAMGTPRGRDAGARYLAAFVEEMKSSGFVARAFARHRTEGASIAPAGPAV
ncbi:MAG TPA: transporter substrate-binding domain-containing protein [Casimicrobiaceae bacterium]|jgi:polar amino acid transport system substrate-binding protein